MRFKVYGPYDIGLGEGFAGWIDEDDAKEFWDQKRRKVVDSDLKRLSEACGVYLFGIHGRKKHKTTEEKLSWYVGKAEKQAFRRECFTHRNLFYFNRVLFKEYNGKGKPFLYFLARVEENGEFSKPAKDEQQFWGLQFVEEMFIQLSLSANNDLVNKSMTKMMKETSIRGFLNMTKKESANVREFKGVFGMRDRKPIDIVQYETTKFRYEVDGPHDVPMKNPNKLKERTIDAERVEKMWRDLEKGQNPVNASCGAYVVGMRNKGNTKPWYVGTAHNWNFEGICFKSDIEKLQKVINSQKGQPVIYFLPRLTEKKQGFQPAKTTKNKPADMDYVKRVLLEYGVQTNEEILFEDSHETVILRDIYVEGFVKSKPGESKRRRSSKTAIEFKKWLVGE